LTASYFEQRPYVDHTFQATAMTLCLWAMWGCFYARTIREALLERRLFETPLVPRWLHACFVFYMGLFYGLAGLSKLIDSGAGWVNGTSMQLWVLIFGKPDALVAGWIVESRPIAQGLQGATLIVELCALPAIFVPRLRLPVAVALLGFHVGQIVVFGWEFYATMALLGLAFLPVCDRCVAWRGKDLMTSTR